MAKLKGNPVGDLVQNVLLEEKGGSNFATTEWYTLRYGTILPKVFVYENFRSNFGLSIRRTYASAGKC